MRKRSHEPVFLARRLHGGGDPIERPWLPHYSGAQLEFGRRVVKPPVRCRCGALLLIVPCIACGCDPTQGTEGARLTGSLASRSLSGRSRP